MCPLIPPTNPSKTGAACVLALLPVALSACSWVCAHPASFGGKGPVLWFAAFFRLGCVVLGGGSVFFFLFFSAWLRRSGWRGEEEAEEEEEDKEEEEEKE